MLILNYLTQLEYLPRKVKDKHFKFVDYLLLFKTYLSLTTKHLTIFLMACVAPIIPGGGHSGPKSWCTVP